MGGRAGEPAVVLRPERAAVRRSLRNLSVGTVALTSFVWFAWWKTGDLSGPASAVCPLLLGTCEVVCGLRTRLVLTTHTAVVRTRWRGHPISATEIHGVQALRSGGVAIWTADRRQHLVPVRLSSPDGRDPVDVVGQWWLAHRGPDWQPHWAPSSTRWYDAAPGTTRVAHTPSAG